MLLNGLCFVALIVFVFAALFGVLYWMSLNDEKENMQRQKTRQSRSRGYAYSRHDDHYRW